MNHFYARFGSIRDVDDVSPRAHPRREILAKAGQGWLNVTRSVRVEDMKGKILLLDFWTYGCVNCMQISA